MGTYDELEVGEELESPSRKLDEHLLRQLVDLGGYTHPLFKDPDVARKTQMGQIPFPGEALLLIMGGLLEQTDKFDETTIALVGFDEVSFRVPAFAGDEVRVLATVLSKKPSSSASRGVVTFQWICVNGDGEPLVDAKAKMLFSR